jgi:hypothetical protein
MDIPDLPSILLRIPSMSLVTGIDLFWAIENIDEQ